MTAGRWHQNEKKDMCRLHVNQVKLVKEVKVVYLEWYMVIGKELDWIFCRIQHHLEKVFPNTLSHQWIDPDLTIFKSSFSPP